MKYIKYLALAFIISMPISAYAGFGTANTDYPEDLNLSAYYDLRDRNSFIQITNTSQESCSIHVQIFQQDRGCSELDFFDVLTANDTVVYDLDNIIRNDGSPVPVNLNDDSYGYVSASGECIMIGNFRIIDNAGYEYRTNMQGITDTGQATNLYANFNTVDGANFADIVAFSYTFQNNLTVINNDLGHDADVFVFDMNEEPLSCDRRNFACGVDQVSGLDKVMNYGVNEDYPNSRGGPLLCPGGGLADPYGGFIHLTNISFPNNSQLPEGNLTIKGYIGINNGNGTGSMDSFFQEADDDDPL